MGVYSGRSRADLQARLAALQAVYDGLVSGQQVASASYSQSDGSRSVTFRNTDLSVIRAEIAQIQALLGFPGAGRRRVNFVF